MWRTEEKARTMIGRTWPAPASVRLMRRGGVQSDEPFADGQALAGPLSYPGAQWDSATIVLSTAFPHTQPSLLPTMTETYPRGVVAVNDDDWKASSIYTQDDPLSLMIRPPASESLWEKEARIELEAEARRVSEQIDAGIRRDKVQRAKSKNDVKVRRSPSRASESPF